MQSRQDHIIAVKKRRDTKSEGDESGGAARYTEFCGATKRGVLNRQCMQNSDEL